MYWMAAGYVSAASFAFSILLHQSLPIAACVIAGAACFAFELVRFASQRHQQLIRRQIHEGNLKRHYAAATGVIANIIATLLAGLVLLSGYLGEFVLERFDFADRARLALACVDFGIAGLLYGFGPILGIWWLIRESRANVDRAEHV